jgi:hypothetical protein
MKFKYSEIHAVAHAEAEITNEHRTTPSVID